MGGYCQPPAQVSYKIPVARLQFTLKLFDFFMPRLKVRIHLAAMVQVVSDDAIDLGKGERRKILANFFSSRTLPESMDHAIERYASTSDT